MEQDRILLFRTSVLDDGTRFPAGMPLEYLVSYLMLENGNLSYFPFSSIFHLL